MIENFAPQPYELHAFTRDGRMWLVLGWHVVDGKPVAIASPFGDEPGGGSIARGRPTPIDAVSFTTPIGGCLH
jgi:hypothetical protein